MEEITREELMRWLNHENVTVGTCSLSRLAGNYLCDSSTMCDECLTKSLIVIAESWEAEVSELQKKLLAIAPYCDITGRPITGITIRCRDCEYGKAPEIGCIMLDDKTNRAGRKPDGFCAWGVAK